MAMLHEFYSQATFTLESRWSSTECIGTPNLILNTTQLNETFAYTAYKGQAESCVGKLYDCSAPGICLVNLASTDGFLSYAANYAASQLKKSSDGLPPSVNGELYCEISFSNATNNLNETTKPLSHYILADDSGFCHKGMQCTKDQLLVYGQDNCTGPFTAVNPKPTFTPIAENSTTMFKQHTFGTNAQQPIIWTTHLPWQMVVITPKLVPGIFFFFFISIALAIMFPFFIYNTREYIKTRRTKYLMYALTCFCWILEISLWAWRESTQFENHEGQAIAAQVFCLVYVIASGMTTAMNTYMVYSIVLHKMWSRFLWIFLVLLISVYLAGPLLMVYFFDSDRWNTNPVVLYIYTNWYVPVVPIGWWILFTLLFDPACSIVVSLYIISTVLMSKARAKSITTYKVISVFFQDRRMIFLLSIVVLNLVLYFLTVYIEKQTVWLQSDYGIWAFFGFWKVQLVINAVCSMCLVEHFPVVLVRMMKLRNRLKQDSSTINGSHHRMNSSSTQVGTPSHSEIATQDFYTSSLKDAAKGESLVTVPDDSKNNFWIPAPILPASQTRTGGETSGAGANRSFNPFDSFY